MGQKRSIHPTTLSIGGKEQAVALITTGTKVPQKLIGLCIVDILEKYSSEKRPMTQEAIRTKLKEEYGIVVDRRTIHRHIKPLFENIERLETSGDPALKTVNGRKTEILTGFYLKGEKDGIFEDIELQMLIYSAIFSKHLRIRHKEDLVRKLASLSSSRIGDTIDCCIYNDEDTRSIINELTWNLEELTEAICDKKKVSFEYEHYEADMRLRTEVQVLTVSPLGIGIRDDDFYLVGLVNGVQNDSPEGMISHLEEVIKAMEEREVYVDTFRLDRIKSIEVLDEDRDELNAPRGLHLRGAHNDTFNIQEYLRENPSLKSGRAINAEFLLTEGSDCSLTDVIDHFGQRSIRKASKLSEKSSEPSVYAIAVRTNSGAMRDFALRHAKNIAVTGPEDLRDDLMGTYRLAYERMTNAIQG